MVISICRRCITASPDSAITYSFQYPGCAKANPYIVLGALKRTPTQGYCAVVGAGALLSPGVLELLLLLSVAELSLLVLVSGVVVSLLAFCPLCSLPLDSATVEEP